MRSARPHVLIIIMFSSRADQSLYLGFLNRRAYFAANLAWVLASISVSTVPPLYAQDRVAEPKASANAMAPANLTYSCKPSSDIAVGSFERFGETPDIQRFIASDIEVAANELLLQAESAIYDGEVELIRGELYLHADRASLDLDSQNVQLLGEVKVALPGARLEGDSASINLTNNASVISGAKYFIQETPSITGSAGSVALDENKVVSILDGTYTRCDPESKQWELSAGELRLDPESGQGYARDATVRVLDTPIVYIPRLRFPIGDQRQSGFLFPSITRRSDGLDISVPYYFNLASHYDFLLAPRYRAGHGYLTEAQFRWMNRYDDWAFNTLFIDSDDSFEGASRWAVSIDESSHWPGSIKSTVAIDRVSDADVPRDLQSNNFSITRSSALSMSGQLEWFHRYGVIGAAVNRYQSIDPTFEIPNEKLPELWSDLTLPAKGALPGFNASVQYTAFEADSLFATAGDNAIQRTRGRVEFYHNVNRTISRWRFGLGSEFRYYALEQNDSGSAQGLLNGETDSWINIPEASVQWSSDWLRESRSETSKNTAELLQPQITYRYRKLDAGTADINQLPTLDTFQYAASANELYESGQFGGDALDPRSHLAVALRYSRSAGAGSLTNSPEIGHITLGALNYFERGLPNANADDAFDSQRRWFADAGSELGGNWWASGTIVWSQEQSVVDYAATYLQYRAVEVSGRSAVFNLGYQRREDTGRFSRREDIEHIDFSTAYPVLDRWALFARIQYDTVNSRHNEGLVGLEFNDCCFRLRFIYRDGIVYRPEEENGERDRALLLQIQLKGLGGIGGSVDDLLVDAIKGFRAD